MNKIKYGLKNVHYAVATIGTDNSATYDTPVPIPGAVSLSMDAQGERTPFYADNIEYYVSPGNDGYEGNLEIARIPESFVADVLNEANDANGVAYEDMTADVVHFALMFQFEGDESATRHVLYNCTAGRPTISGETKGENIDPQTETLSLRAKSIFASDLGTSGKDIVKARTNGSTSTSVYESWFSTVYVATATTAT